MQSVYVKVLHKIIHVTETTIIYLLQTNKTYYIPDNFFEYFQF